MIVTVCFAVACLFHAGLSFAEPVRILMVETMPVPAVLEHERAFVEGLEHLGYGVGKDVAIDTIKGQGDSERIKTGLAEYLSRHKPDIVVSFATLASVAAHEALDGTDIPLVFCVVSDPVGAGLIKEVGKPTGTNVTGLVFSLMHRAKMDLAKSLLTQPFPGRPVRVGVVHSDYPAAVAEVNAMSAIADEDGRIRFESHKVKFRPIPEGLESMLAEASEGIAALSSEVDYWWIVPGPLGETAEFSRLLLDTTVPVGLCHTENCCKGGGLLFIGPENGKGGRQVASMVDRILTGTAPGNIPPVPPDSFDMGINLTTAIELNIVIPSQYLELAGEHVWR
ncbi:ABC transporter substrate-binding protein [Pseudodesulfovibrio sp. S3-i]|uniref:ABC transporter substrate-binding protein n=1 Tax=Pseudodesulfovibrio sp. S3-i TaxID=2929474 RepID=UPI001FB9F1A0|nr:ABC transporter substrate-binding protein [Pseudodesulfovibrio sp. S3-i]MCJ2163503.1 ABC transporter substrate-binding protein [Pseudodesulfovibrio sp. S3-i]